MPRLFCFGYSYTAKALVRRLRSAPSSGDWEIMTTIRDENEADALKAEDVEPHLFGGAASHAALTSASHILVSVPPGKNEDPVLGTYGETLAGLAPSWLGYLSTTGPYGDCGGAWIDETAPTNPSGERGQRRLDAERAWATLCQANHLPLHIFRLPGLYGPGRSALDRVRDATARRIIKQGQVFSRIHINDLAAILKASMDNPNPGPGTKVASKGALYKGVIYNVADDLPAPPQDVTTFAAELLGLTPPPEIPFEEARLSPMARSFYGDNKRISNRLIKSEFGISLQYPTYREGLKAILDAEGQSPFRPNGNV